ncbi:MAG: hypothetical protein FWH47_04085 [Methanomassiliicoccaceae archaeon]|nr:hypothetical protein [Methanomassiliicoccaceae archaeon]
MMTDYSQIRGLFVELDAYVLETTVVYLIGGAALMKRGMKPLTKDIDIVADSEGDFDVAHGALLSAGFRPALPSIGYERLALSQILIRGDFRVDLFCKRVCGRFSLSEKMKNRSTIDDLPTTNLGLAVCSPEDVFLFKTMTDRAGDLEDCSAIVKNKADFDWSIVLDEAGEQSKTGQGVWITWIASRLEEFAEGGMSIPILRDVTKLADEYLAEWERGLLLKGHDVA